MYLKLHQGIDFSYSQNGVHLGGELKNRFLACKAVIMFGIVSFHFSWISNLLLEEVGAP